MIDFLIYFAAWLFAVCVVFIGFEVLAKWFDWE